MASYRRLAVVAVVLLTLFAGSSAAARVVTAPRVAPGAVAPVKSCAEFRKIMKEVSGTYDATDPDLSAFAASGGKLILWHGWADPGISPVGTIAYDQAVRDRSTRTRESPSRR